ncbi:hypothetical protein FLJC2902T_02240 [Flavobacterium limnosediminis JC2902]|uniref:Uncharacterized protein n=1 Tax=Flavobacterium limnosediminis JC2902 TaxID=1341181 RepID=V6STH0_9FLAO|nr:hypothetical protein FLJC2902T_02240 [Flavobacterium limnosediminis JC2902]
MYRGKGQWLIATVADNSGNRVLGITRNAEKEKQKEKKSHQSVNELSELMLQKRVKV